MLNQTFIRLVRLGIGHTTEPLSSPISWSEIQDLANKQGLSAIVLDGIEKLPDRIRPPKEQSLQWIGEVLQNYENRYELYRSTIAEMAGFYNSHGFEMMVLKGYACSLNWPKPEHRPCGDIDIWLFGHQEAADALLESIEFRDESLGSVQGDKGFKKFKIDRSHHHHTVFYWRDFMVENHYDFLNTITNRTSSQLEPILKELAMDDTNSVEVNGEKVYLPSANLNALFLLRHMLMHFVAGGISLRNILDWAFFWEKEGEKVDTVWLKGIVDQYHMDAFFNIVNAICVDDLGFSPIIFPSVKSNPTLKERVLKDTLEPEYDWKDAHRLGFLKRLLFKYKRWKACAWKRELCYGESNWASFWMSIWSHVLKPSSI